MSRVARRYAKALFELALEEKNLDTVNKDFEMIRDLLENSQDFSDFVKNPLISANERADILKQIFEGKLSEMSYNFLNMVNEKKRLDFLQEIVESFQLFVKKNSGIVEGELLSAIELNKTQIERIRKNVEQLTGKSVILNQQIDPSVLGGFVVKIEDLVIDNSIRRQLQRLREQLIAR